MSCYWENDLCILLMFRIWWEELCNICEDYFEKENIWRYLCDTLKQSFSIFDEYYNLFFKKKKCSHFEDSLLIDAMKRNINYDLIMRTVNYRMINEFKSKIFFEHVEMYQKINQKLCQIKYLHSKQNNISASNNSFFCKIVTAAVTLSSSINWISVAVSTVITKSNAEISLLFSEEKFMNFSQIQIIIKELSIKVSDVKKICKKFNLYFYCKLQHSDFDVRNCSNKNKKKSLFML